MSPQTPKNHVCAKRQATSEEPYHYTGSGLSNLYLSGITYYVCECGNLSAEIPAMKDLFAALARTLVSKTSPLTGPEARFLRKHLSKKAVEFAPMVSLTPEHLSSLENSPAPLDLGRDKLLRLIYRAMSEDKNLVMPQKEFERWITSIHKGGTGERINASRLANNQWKVEALPVAA
jgi:hypothetical protein